MRFIVVAVLAFGCQTSPGADDEPVARSTSPLGQHILMKLGPPAPNPAAANNLLSYYGGRVLSHPQVVQVLWGTGVAPELVSGMPDFYRNVLQSPYMDWLGEYDTINVAAGLRLGQGVTTESKQKIGRGTFLSTVQITPSNTSTALQDAQVMTELAAQIDAGVLPAPLEDGHGGYHTLYMIEFPAGISITAPGPGSPQSCVEYCAYHSAGMYKGKALAFGVLVDLTQPGCAGNCGMGATSFANASSVHSHELIEATTDPDLPILLINGGTTIDAPAAWFSDGGGGEIGDICNAMEAMVGTFTVQKEYSNSQGACITAITGQPTCIDGVPGGCTACTSNAQCSGATSACATDAGDAKNGECVACIDGTTCAGATPVCDKSGGDLNDTCRGCTANADCAAPTPVCVTATMGALAGGSCVECLASTDCMAAKPVCDITMGACTGCKSDMECMDPANPSCDSDTGVCGVSSGCGCASGAPLSTSSVVLFGSVLALLLRRRRR
jgi:hypothetical protein